MRNKYIMKTYEFNCVCSQCSKTFYKKPSKVGKKNNFCSILCMKSYREDNNFKTKKRVCAKCSNAFFPCYKPQVFCSRKCSMDVVGAVNSETNTYKTKCVWCKATFKKKLSQKSIHNDFCSSKCSEAHIRGSGDMYVKKNCIRCGVEFECLFRRQKKYCSKKCSSLYQKGSEHIGYGKEGPTTGMKPWTYGLTKETDGRIAKLGTKVSVTQKRMFKDGFRTNAGQYNPNFGKTVLDRTPEQLENYSKAAISRVLSNKMGGGYRAKTGKHYSLKLCKEVTYRSQYEKDLMEAMDKDSNIITYTYENIIIKYDTGKRYIPDFLVFYANGNKKMIEVKGYIRDEEKHRLKVLAAEKYCKENNIESYEVWGQNQIRKYSILLGISRKNK